MRYGIGLSACLMVTFAATSAQAKFAPATDAPVERLLRNTESYIQEKPDDPQGYYTLARLHLLAFCLQADHVPVYERKEEKLPQFNIGGGWVQGKGKTRIDANKAVEHITVSIANYHKALAKRPGDSLYELGLASAMEAAAPVSCFIGLPIGEATPDKSDSAVVQQLFKASQGTHRAEAAKAIRANLKSAAPSLAIELTHSKEANYYNTVAGLLAEYYRHEAADAYFRAFKAKSAEDSKQQYQPLEGPLAYISYEAGVGFLRIAETDPCASQWKDRMDEINQTIAKIEKQPMGPVTPIIFSLQVGGELSELLAPALKVQFDLDGDGLAEQRPWVRPDTAILVWDDSHRGQITSGKQLFGSVTFFMFWRNGYEPLSALDDNRDGEVRGSELAGLALWHDRNGNAISDPGEVTPLSSSGIQALSVRPEGDDNGSPMARRGVQLQAGQWLPTWDWTLGD